MTDSSTDPGVWEQFRERMPVTRKWAYFDHAAVAPLPAPSCDALCRWAVSGRDDGLVDWLEWRKEVDRARAAAIQLLRCRDTELCLIRSTTEGIGLVAEGFPWQPGDNVVTFAGEFPSNSLPWQNLASRGVEVRQVPTEHEQFHVSDLEAALDARTRIVAISWVGFGTGWRNDLVRIAEIVHRRGAHLFVDAIQGAGVLPLDLADVPIDYLAADGHKWMLGPEGAGVLFVREKHLDQLRPLGIGWNSVPTTGDFGPASVAALKPAAVRYEGGTCAQGVFAAFGRSLSLLNDVGPDRIAARLFEIGQLLCESVRQVGGQVVSDRHPDHFSGIISCDFPGRDPQALRNRLLQAGIVSSVRLNRLRLSPHIYNSADDLDQLAAELGASSSV